MFSQCELLFLIICSRYLSIPKQNAALTFEEDTSILYLGYLTDIYEHILKSLGMSSLNFHNFTIIFPGKGCNTFVDMWWFQISVMIFRDIIDEISVISVMRYQWYLWWFFQLSVMRYQWYHAYNGGADLNVADRAGMLMTKVKNMMKKKTAMKSGNMSQELSHFPVIAM